MANDPGLANDTCIFLEAVPGDNGAHSTNPIWWLSSDVELIGPVSGLDRADAGQTNPLKVKFHRKPAGSNCIFPGDESLSIEVWVANPSIAMSPSIKGSATRVGFIGAPLPAEGGNGVQQIDWTPSGSANNPESPGQKCLVARCYSSSKTSSAESFFLPGDQHVVQRNLCLAAISEKRLTMTVNTVHLGPPVTLPSASIKLRAILDLAPSRFTVASVRKRLPTLPTPISFRTTPLPNGFKFSLTGFNPTNVVDNTTSSIIVSPNFVPTYEAQVALPIGRVVQIPFEVNLTGVSTNEVCIFHLIQLSDNVAQGGLTLIVLRI